MSGFQPSAAISHDDSYYSVQYTIGIQVTKCTRYRVERSSCMVCVSVGRRFLRYQYFISKSLVPSKKVLYRISDVIYFCKVV